ncbi:MAG: type II toxin-antitoxin system RelE/ParE family toxin [Candidatus Hydrogenedentes bacterium]|nr:type II toxin-antitoxin system RelE/ParE family toxin [Candidatus Hydrogenedentota bacterium]MBI3118334.1 type II toxin-antitoxin system RelE/ParE family toxin [Candidatus Hydrogenedentota bacterium]
MNLIIHDDAQCEFEAAVAYYNSECPGLGYEFEDEVYRTLERIQDLPLAWQSLSARTRRCLTRRFPYGIIYQIEESEILIVSIMHLHRKPDTWRNRTDQPD